MGLKPSMTFPWVHVKIYWFTLQLEWILYSCKMFIASCIGHLDASTHSYVDISNTYMFHVRYQKVTLISPDLIRKVCFHWGIFQNSTFADKIAYYHWQRIMAPNSSFFKRGRCYSFILSRFPWDIQFD